MSDIAQRLREESDILPHESYTWLNPLLLEAATEIERLRAAIQEMTLRAGAGYDRADSVEWLESILRIGRAALLPTPGWKKE